MGFACGRVIGEAEQAGLDAQVGRFFKTNLPILKPVYSHGLLANGIGLAVNAGVKPPGSFSKKL
jgi:hypothetical protein